MRDLIERAYFAACLTLGKLLRAGRYSKTLVVNHQVRKHRTFYAPLLIWMGAGLMKLLDTGVRVLPRREWMERERRIYEVLYGTSIAPVTSGDSALILPRLPGETLAALLEDPNIDDALRREIIERAAAALADFHRRGLTHGDAMVENVMIDLDAGVARWFDFETIHESSGSRQWADDVRALLATCLVRTAHEKHAETLQLILDAYADDEVTRILTESFSVILKRPLTFHLGQAPLSVQGYRQIAHLLSAATRDERLPSDRSMQPGAPVPGMQSLRR
jgi:tRNA A-37 threonylcarbamoyl transferase component Bud32